MPENDPFSYEYAPESPYADPMGYPQFNNGGSFLAASLGELIAINSDLRTRLAQKGIIDCLVTDRHHGHFLENGDPVARILIKYLSQNTRALFSAMLTNNQHAFQNLASGVCVEFSFPDQEQAERFSPYIAEQDPDLPGHAIWSFGVRNLPKQLFHHLNGLYFPDSFA